MVEFLSAEWIARADELASVAALQGPSGAGRAHRDLTITQVVTGTIGGDVSYQLAYRAADGRVHVTAGTPSADDVRFTTDLATAVTIARGTGNAQQAFVDGRLDLRGDVERLLDARDLLAAIGDALEPLQAATRYPD